MQQPTISDDIQTKIKTDLAKLDEERINIEGIHVTPSQCYHVGLDPLHVLFNTNCPDSLKEKVNKIISGYFPDSSSDNPIA